MLKVLIASHSHPQLSKGGAEISAFQLFSQIKALEGYESWFLGCDQRRVTEKPGATFSQPYSDQEYLYTPGAYDWFKFANTDLEFPRKFRALLKRLRPQVIHFHHYITFGVEVFFHVRAVLPKCKIVLTLHEFLALCHHYGQMITKRESALCYEATPNQCAACFDDIPASDFFLRKLYIQRFFELVDHFIAPSQFLAERYIAWGIARERMSVIENAIPAPKRRPRPAAGIQTGKVLRVGFFGQISALKGINVLFEAAAILLDAKQNGIVFEIHGDYRNQPPDLQEDFLRRLAKAGRNVKFHGPYDERRVDALMQTVDLILVPSIWWENSPVVIQEALRNRRLVVCSDIGGMAEKIRDGVDGFHFPVGNSTALAALLRQLAKTQPKLMKLQSTMASPPSMDYVVNRHTELYGTLISQN